MYSNPSVYEQTVYEFLLIRDAQINTCFSIYGPDRLRGPPSLLSNGYRGFFPPGGGGVKRGRGVTLTTHPHLVPRLRMGRNYTSSPPMCLHGL
jgi:hypothetical protein